VSPGDNDGARTPTGRTDVRATVPDVVSGDGKPNGLVVRIASAAAGGTRSMLRSTMPGGCKLEEWTHVAKRCPDLADWAEYRSRATRRRDPTPAAPPIRGCLCVMPSLVVRPMP